MKKLIRKLINWAYGINIESELFTLRQANQNLFIALHDALLRLKGE